MPATRKKSKRKRHDRELIATGCDKRYVRWDSKGHLRESHEVGASLKQDRKKG